MKKISRIFIIALSIVCIVLAIISVFSLTDLLTKTLNNRLIATLAVTFIGGFYLLFTLTVCFTIHELGHLVCGLISNYSFSSFRINSLVIIKQENKLKFKRFSVIGTGGQCLMLPPPPNENGEIPYKLYNYGGSLFNAIFAVVFLIPVLIYFNNPIILSIFAPLSLVSLMLLINNGIPLRTELLQNDAQNAIDIAKSKEALFSFYVQLCVAESLSRNVNICNMPKDWFTLPKESEFNNPLVSTRVGFIATKQLYEGDHRGAHLTMQNLNKNAPDMLGYQFIAIELDLIYLDALYNWDTQESLLERYEIMYPALKRLKFIVSVYRVFYTVELLCKKDEQEANKIYAKFEKFAKNYPYQQEIEEERKLMALAYNRFKELNEQTAPTDK